MILLLILTVLLAASLALNVAQLVQARRRSRRLTHIEEIHAKDKGKVILMAAVKGRR